jgi:DNA-binding transcriptional MerR regulator/quercetin dioxygenase-like cupin family protein
VARPRSEPEYNSIIEDDSCQTNVTANQPVTKRARAGFLTVGQTARILGVSPSTLRLWESVGLISPARSDGRFRLYDPDLLEVLKRIKYLRDVKKLSVPGIKQMLGNKVPRGDSNGNHQPQFGERLRKMRQELKLPITEAAKRAKISIGFLSAIELSKANPSIATLQRLAAAYHSTVLEFFDLPRHRVRLLHPDQRRELKSESGVRMELLSVGTKMLECMLFRVPPGTGSDGAYAHEGEEFIYMMAGELEIWLDEQESYFLRTGDSFWFESNLGHRWFNPSKKEAVLIWINTPPTF